MCFWKRCYIKSGSFCYIVMNWYYNSGMCFYENGKHSLFFNNIFILGNIWNKQIVIHKNKTNKYIWIKVFTFTILPNSYEDITIFGEGECDTMWSDYTSRTPFHGILWETPSTYNDNWKWCHWWHHNSWWCHRSCDTHKQTIWEYYKKRGPWCSIRGSDGSAEGSIVSW